MSVNRIFEKKERRVRAAGKPGGFRRNPAVQRPPSERRTGGAQMKAGGGLNVAAAGFQTWMGRMSMGRPLR
jgi:hypothetical protein